MVSINKNIPTSECRATEKKAQIKEMIKIRKDKINEIDPRKGSVERWELINEIGALEAGNKLLGFIKKLEADDWQETADKYAKSIKKATNETFYKVDRFNELKEIYNYWNEAISSEKQRHILEKADEKKAKQRAFWHRDNNYKAGSIQALANHSIEKCKECNANYNRTGETYCRTLGKQY